MSRYRKAVASALWLQLALVACYKPLGVVEALFTQSGQPSLIFFVRQLKGHWFLAQLYTQTEHSCGYCTLCSGVLFYPRLSILYISYNLFLENSHFLVSPSTQHAVPVGAQYRLVLCSAPPCPASVVVL